MCITLHRWFGSAIACCSHQFSSVTSHHIAHKPFHQNAIQMAFKMLWNWKLKKAHAFIYNTQTLFRVFMSLIEKRDRARENTRASIAKHMNACTILYRSLHIHCQAIWIDQNACQVGALAYVIPDVMFAQQILISSLDKIERLILSQLRVGASHLIQLQSASMWMSCKLTGCFSPSTRQQLPWKNHPSNGTRCTASLAHKYTY